MYGFIRRAYKNHGPGYCSWERFLWWHRNSRLGTGTPGLASHCSKILLAGVSLGILFFLNLFVNIAIRNYSTHYFDYRSKRIPALGLRSGIYSACRGFLKTRRLENGLGDLVRSGIGGGPGQCIP